jgi:hypothetical protein
MPEPVLLLEWLDDQDGEMAAIAEEFRDRLNIRTARPETSSQVLESIGTWLTRNTDQYLIYLGAHGALEDEESNEFIGITSCSTGGALLAWDTLAKFLAESGASESALVIGACGSSHCVEAFSRQLRRGYVPCAWLVTIDGNTFPGVLSVLLRQAILNSRLDPIVFLEDELPTLVASAGCAIQMFYPGPDGGYADVSEMTVDEFRCLLGSGAGRKIFKYER